MQFLQNAAAPCALFALGVTVALRPLQKMPWEVPMLVRGQAALHPVLVFLLLSLFGPFERTWVYTAVLMAALPPALNVFVFARQYDCLGRAGFERGADRHPGVGGHADQRDVDGEIRRAAAAVVRRMIPKSGNRFSDKIMRKESMQPLAGFLVLDFTTLLPGPLATLMLAEAGAEVIKIERPGGEDMRRFAPPVAARARPSRCSTAARRASRRSQGQGRPR